MILRSPRIMMSMKPVNVSLIFPLWHRIFAPGRVNVQKKGGRIKEGSPHLSEESPSQSVQFENSRVMCLQAHNILSLNCKQFWRLWAEPEEQDWRISSLLSSLGRQSYSHCRQEVLPGKVASHAVLFGTVKPVCSTMHFRFSFLILTRIG